MNNPLSSPNAPWLAQRSVWKKTGTLLAAVVSLALGGPAAQALEPVPDKLAVLTFDDSVANHATYVAPLLKKLGFGATFFITEGFTFLTDKEHYLTWEQVHAMHRMGFEIGNHTRNHKGVANLNPETLLAEISHIEERCEAHGIPKPKTFCYPGYGASPVAAQFLRNRGYLFARSGGNRVFDPDKDDALILPQAFDGKPNCTLDTFKAAVENARDGKIAILTFHGVPDIQHPWVSTEREKFEAYMQHLKDTGFKVVSLGELSRYVAPKPTPHAAPATPPPGAEPKQSK